MAFTDTFTGTDGQDLPVYSANWVTPTGANPCEIQSGHAVSTTPNTHSCAYWNASFNDKHYAKSIQTGAGSITGPAVRVQSGANSFYYAYQVNTTVYAGEVIAGTATDWDAGQTGFTLGDVVELAIDATTSTTVHLKKNGTIVQTYTGKSALSGGAAGVACYTDGAEGIDSWEGGDVAGGSASAPKLSLLGVG